MKPPIYLPIFYPSSSPSISSFLYLEANIILFSPTLYSGCKPATTGNKQTIYSLTKHYLTVMQLSTWIFLNGGGDGDAKCSMKYYASNTLRDNTSRYTHTHTGTHTQKHTLTYTLIQYLHCHISPHSSLSLPSPLHFFSLLSYIFLEHKFPFNLDSPISESL